MNAELIVYATALGGGLVAYYYRQRRKLAGMQPLVATCGDEEVSVRTALVKGDVAPLRDMLTRNAGDHELVDLLLTQVIDELVPHAPFERWAAEEPQSAIARLCLGVRLIKLAWQARGHGAASTVNERAADLFWERLEEAERELATAATLDPSDPAPWAFLIVVGRGLGTAEETARAHFEEAVRRDPGHVSAHLNLLLFLSKRWLGSHEKMLAFARESVARLGEGSPLELLVAQAHNVVQDHMFHFDEDRAVRKAYLANASVRAEVDQAWERFTNLSPQDRPAALVAHNHFARWYFEVKDRERCRAAVGHVANRFTVDPWYVVGGNARMAIKLHEWLGAR
jgi:hypothetical protein